MKKITILIAAILTVSAFAAEPSGKSDKTAKDNLQNNFKPYGFIRNYFSFDSRVSKSGTGDLFYYLPLDEKLNADGDDLNATPSFRFLALTSRLGVDVSGYNIGNVHFGAKIEGDFYAGLSSVDAEKYPDVKNFFPDNSKISGTAQARLRQAFVTITWKDLPMNKEEKASVGLKVGQAWHPMAADHPHLFALEVGAPFGPFSRTPLVQMDANLGNNWVVSAAAIWQMQYQSAGPVGTSSIYMKYGCTPEMYAALAYKNKGFLVRAGVDMVSIKPRVQGTVPNPTAEDPDAVKVVKVSERKTSLLYYLYTQYSYKKFAIKAKTTYGEGGEHLNLMSGYAHVSDNPDGSWNYASMRNSSSWISMLYGKKWQVGLFAGYVKNFGLAQDSENVLASKDIYFCGNGSSNINQMYRVQPSVVYNVGKLNLGLEYQWTSVQYGSFAADNRRALATENLHWVGNHRINMMVKYNF